MDSRFQLAQTPFACLRWLERNEVHWAGKRCCCQPPARQTACLPGRGGVVDPDRRQGSGYETRACLLTSSTLTTKQEVRVANANQSLNLFCRGDEFYCSTSWELLWQEAELSQRDRATRWNLVNCYTTIRKIPFKNDCNIWVTLTVTQGQLNCRYPVGHISLPVSGLW